MKDLDQLRQEILHVDRQLLATIAERMKIVDEIAKIKLQQKLPITDRAVERTVAANISQILSELDLPKSLSEKITKLLTELARERQSKTLL